MAAYYGKSRVFDPRFLARKAKLDSINSIFQNPHGWTSILGKLSVDPCFPLSYFINARPDHFHLYSLFAVLSFFIYHTHNVISTFILLYSCQLFELELAQMKFYLLMQVERE